MWNLSLSLVKYCTSYNISNFNQGLMELGNQICTPKKPRCSICPIKKFCHSFKEMNFQKRPYNKIFQSIESEQCSLCEPIYFPSMLVENYPLKKKKKTKERVMHHRANFDYFLAIIYNLKK